MTVNNLMPSLFCGHGSPMNIIDNNRYTHALEQLAQKLPKPRALLCISAHWLTDGSFVQASTEPEQIFDFSGFPEALYQIRYRPQGHPQTAERVHQLSPHISLTQKWGLDHGTWALLHKMYPEQNIPTLQLSIDKKLSPLEHLELAKKLIPLKAEGVLILGSGNIVHNLRKIDWNPEATPHIWATDFETFVIKTLSASDLSSEQKVEMLFDHPLFLQCHPTSEHFIPLIYSMGVSPEGSAKVITRGIQNAAVSMACFEF